MTPYFKRKLELAHQMIKKFDVIKSDVNQYWSRHTVKDPQRNIYLEIYIGKKVMGIGQGRVNACRIDFSNMHHPELYGSSIDKADLKLYCKELNIN